MLYETTFLVATTEMTSQAAQSTATVGDHLFPDYSNFMLSVIVWGEEGRDGERGFSERSWECGVGRGRGVSLKFTHTQSQSHTHTITHTYTPPHPRPVLTNL